MAALVGDLVREEEPIVRSDKEENKMKRVFKAIGVFIVGLIFVAFALNNFYTDLVDPYLWHKAIIKRWNDAGWKVIGTSDQPSLMFPWTLVWRPIGRITLPVTIWFKLFIERMENLAL